MARGPSVKTEISAMRAEGRFFTRDVSKTIAENTVEAVEWVAKQGPPIVARELSDLQHPTGFTARSFEGFAYKRTQMVTGRSIASLYGKVRMKPGLSRGGSANWPASRVPYVINAVLESGKWRGTVGNRRAQWHVKRTAARLRGMARAIRVDLTKGLE